MKTKILGFMMLVLSLTSCGLHSEMSDSIKYTVVDTTYIDKGSLKYSEYYVIIKMDSSLYSARMDSWGNLYKIDRKLKIKK